MQIDIFCQVIDNYGDIGVSWRLAQQLASHACVRLFVNDLISFTHIEARIQSHLPHQHIDQIQICSWQYALTCQPADVVIETFGCELPTSYQKNMSGRTDLWINLEYLSAETWVESLHLMPSPQPQGISKYFYFPGFTAQTGGLLRPESWSLVPKHISTTTDPLFWDRLQIEQPKTQCTAFVFPYVNAPLEMLYEALSQDNNTWTVLLAATAPEPKFEPSHSVKIQRLPFIQQTDFDALLDYADLNIIRGEDSFVRAIWAAKPFIWQPYLQDDNTHIIKLEAWLQSSSFDAATQQIIKAWSTGTMTVADLEIGLVKRSHWQQQSEQYALKLAQQSDLVTQLLAFCSQKRQKAVK